LPSLPPPDGRLSTSNSSPMVHRFGGNGREIARDTRLLTKNPTDG
jgi:hypothetical protein